MVLFQYSMYTTQQRDNKICGPRRGIRGIAGRFGNAVKNHPALDVVALANGLGSGRQWLKLLVSFRMPVGRLRSTFWGSWVPRTALTNPGQALVKV